MPRRARAIGPPRNELNSTGGHKPKRSALPNPLVGVQRHTKIHSPSGRETASAMVGVRIELASSMARALLTPWVCRAKNVSPVVILLLSSAIPNTSIAANTVRAHRIGFGTPLGAKPYLRPQRWIVFSPKIKKPVHAAISASITSKVGEFSARPTMIPRSSAESSTIVEYYQLLSILLIDGGLTKVGCLLTHSDHETRSFWRDQTRRFLVTTKSGAVQVLILCPFFLVQEWRTLRRWNYKHKSMK